MRSEQASGGGVDGGGAGEKGGGRWPEGGRGKVPLRQTRQF